MSKKTLIKQEYEQKIKILKKHNKYYFDEDNPRISDSEYDEIKNDVINLEKKYSFLKKQIETKIPLGSISSNKFEKINHLRPMLSLSNAFNKEDMKEFLKKIGNFLNLKGQIELFSEPKIDGISATLIYKNGVLIKGLSRGDGITGENILQKQYLVFQKKLMEKICQK